MPSFHTPDQKDKIARLVAHASVSERTAARVCILSCPHLALRPSFVDGVRVASWWRARGIGTIMDA